MRVNILFIFYQNVFFAFIVYFSTLLFGIHIQNLFLISISIKSRELKFLCLFRQFHYLEQSEVINASIIFYKIHKSTKLF